MRNHGLVLTFFRFRACPSNIHIQEVIITHKINEERKKGYTRNYILREQIEHDDRVREVF